MLTKETQTFIATHREENPRTLALQAKRYPTVDIREAVTQIEGWQQAREKLPMLAATDGIIYPPKISMEQCSSETTALYKASLATGHSFADLTGGFGIDFYYMARGFKKATYIERNNHLCAIARHNTTLLGLLHTTIINGHSEEQLATLPPLDWIFIDPARRDGIGRKVVAITDCEPNVSTLEKQLLAKATKVLVKCSPMLDITAARRELHSIEVIHIVAVNNECKELLFILGNPRGDDTPIHCVNIKKESIETFTTSTANEEKSTATYATEVQQYLYEPNSAIQKAGCFHSLATATGAIKLHPNSNLLTSQEFIQNFPGRKFKVIKTYSFGKEDIKHLAALGKANITVRNFPQDACSLRKRLKLADGGDNYIFATTLANDKKALLLCKKEE